MPDARNQLLSAETSGEPSITQSSALSPQHSLSSEERAQYEWQMWVPGFGEEGQQKLKNASVLISRVGGLGGAVATYLAAAGVGRLVLAHAGNIRPSDLHRQTLMTHARVGSSRIASAAKELSDLNPHVHIEPVAENISEENADRLVGSVDLVVDACPLFTERFALNGACIRQRKPMVEAAMYEMEAHLTTIVPGRSPCLACLYPEPPTYWKRQFPVFGAVSASVGTMAAMEAIKLIAGIGEPLIGRMLTYSLREMSFRVVKAYRDPACPVCGSQDSSQ